MSKFKVNDRVYLPRVIGVWAEVGGKGTVVEIQPKGYTVMFDFGAKIGGLQDHEIAIVDGNEDESKKQVTSFQ